MYYDSFRNVIREESYNSDGTMDNYTISEYSESGELTRTSNYDAQTGEMTGYTDYN